MWFRRHFRRLAWKHTGPIQQLPGHTRGSDNVYRVTHWRVEQLSAVAHLQLSTLATVQLP